MKLVRFGAPGEERPGLWIDDGPEPGRASLLDVRGMAFDIEDFDQHFFTHWGMERVAALRKESAPKIIPAEGVRLGPPIARPSKIICLGANYAAHAKEFGSKVPDKPILFNKATTALAGPEDPIAIPNGSPTVDAEAELAVVLGREARHVSEEKAMDYVAGFMVLNDVTHREAQREVSQWFHGKSYDTFCPAGPYLVTPDEIADPHDLRVFSKLNENTLQDGRTGDMIFTIPFLISYLSSHLTLLPGDVISTGTPPGIGSARTPTAILQPGDLVEVGVEGLGQQRNLVVLAG